jgi:hypothetical protein
MAIALVINTIKSSPDAGEITTDAIDTTGANFLIAALCDYMGVAAGSVTDSKGNTWAGLTEVTTANLPRIRFFVCANATVGSGHTFTAENGGSNSSPCIVVAAFSGVKTSSPTDQQNGAFSPNQETSLQTGSVTPTEDNELVVAALCHTGTGATINSSMTITDDADADLNDAFGGAMAYIVQTTAGAINPTFSFAAGNPAAVIATFKSGGTAPDAPTIGTATAAGTDAIDLTWTDNADDETQFRVQYDRVNTFDQDPQEIVVDTEDTESTEVGDLTPAGVEWFLRVRAENEFGNSDWSATVSATTDAEEAEPEATTPSSPAGWLRRRRLKF